MLQIEKMKKLNKIYSKGCRRILLALLEKERRWRDLERIEDKRTVSQCIDVLIKLGLAKPYIDYSESVKGVKKYKLTKKGVELATRLKELEDFFEKEIVNSSHEV